ncbi:hypothetical protein PIB30_077412 [Stylosanthes scabra]|uniref:Uncharacterized protein n=1 Tax=Stylosanthes scabra TaxID=79078 RepID=A0ABU6VQ54_9FABA|nr:hypothetical protein [Stylosanthes scabra]
MSKVPNARRELTHRMSSRTRRLLGTSPSMVPYERLSQQHQSDLYRPLGTVLAGKRNMKQGSKYTGPLILSQPTGVVKAKSDETNTRSN